MNKTLKKAKAKPKAKSVQDKAPQPEVRPEDFAKAFRENYRAPSPVPSSNAIVLDPDVAPHFQNSRAVNEALRALLRIVKQVRG